MPKSDSPQDQFPSQQLTFIERFIWKYYGKQTAAVRSFVFVLFSVVFAYSILRMIGGDFHVHGRIFEKVGEHRVSPGTDYDVVVGERYFGVNSRGEYYILLNAVDYYQSMALGNFPLAIYKKDNSCFKQYPRGIDRRERELEVLTVSGDCQIVQAEMPAWAPPVQPASSSPAFASTGPPTQAARLFVTGITLASRAGSIKEGTLELRLGSEVVPLLSGEAGGARAGAIPVLEGQEVVFEPRYYFPLPFAGRNSRSLSGQIEFRANTGFLSSYFDFLAYVETFALNQSMRSGEKFVAQGDKASRIDLLLLDPYNVVIFNKRDLAGVMEGLRNDLLQSGFYVSVRGQSPLGYGAETNSLFGGSAVPFYALQSVLRVLRDRGIRVKTIQYHLNLKSGNPFEIQVGGSRASEARTPIPLQHLDRIVLASTEEEFRNRIAAYLPEASNPEAQ